MSKHELGQYYTTSNPFSKIPLKLWKKHFRGYGSFMDPFAGAGHLSNYIKGNWTLYDIEPGAKGIIKRDTLKSFPKGHKVCVTNPPYLAKNRNKDIQMKHEDLYLDCLEVCLNNCEYVAAIIPFTMWNTGLFRDRLMFFDKLDKDVFSDTDCPVAVAYFGPGKYKTRVFVNGKELVNWEKYEPKNPNTNITFNDPEGKYVFNAIDKLGRKNIHINKDVKGFDREKYLKGTSRNYSLVSGNIDMSSVNDTIKKWRNRTMDFFLSPFKSYKRKRMGFDQFRCLIDENGKGKNINKLQMTPDEKFFVKR